MKRLTSALLIAFCALPLTAAADDGIFPYPTHVKTFDNGLQAIVIPMSSGGLVAYWTIIRTGSRDEYEAGRTGFAHFFEHMMFRGTERFPAEAYGEMLTEVGADSNAFTSIDLTAYHLGIASEDLERVMDVEADRFQNLAYPKDMFETEAGAVYGEYRKARTNPFFAAYEASREAAFDVHTYGHTTIGLEADIQGMPKLFDYSKTFFDRYYRPENAMLLIVGDVEPDATFPLIDKYYGGWQPGYRAPDVVQEPEQTAERNAEVAFEGRSLPILWLAYKTNRGYQASDRQLAAVELLGELAFGSTSDLYRQLVLDEQLAESISGSYDPQRDAGLFDVVVAVKDEANMALVREHLETAIERFRSQPPDQQRLADAQSRLRYGFLMNLDTPDSVASNLAGLLSVTGDPTAIDQRFRTLAEVTPDDVQRAAQNLLTGENRTVVLLKGQQ